MKRPIPGKRAAVYTWTAPDGTVVRRHTYSHSAKTVRAYPFQGANSKWYMPLCDGTWSLDREPIIATRER